MASGESFYVTTPIFYVNDVPHIGHAYAQVAADVLARWHQQRGEDTWFLTGTDEHGQKIMRSAIANNMTPREWADKLVDGAWRPVLETLNLSNDDFIRTTEDRHETFVADFLSKLNNDGYIYEDEFEALYCVGCEEFKPEAEIVDGTGDYEGKKVCAIHSKPMELMRERNYFFKLSEFQDRLLEFYEANPKFVQPESARNEVLSFVRSGLLDLSISRTSFDWGVKVPWDDSHVVYVWVDALLNYLSALSTVEGGTERYWPANHIVGKDILRFHAIIWPALLMAAGIEPPKRVYATGWLLVGGEKMSKSKLTGIEPAEITKTFGADAFRYYFMRAIRFGHDGSFSWEDIHARYHAELANGLGNLASRTIAMVNKYFGGELPTEIQQHVDDEQLLNIAAESIRTADAAIDEFAIDQALAATWKLVDALNLYITEQEPWKLAKDEANRDRLAAVLDTALRGVGVLAVLINPVMPETAAKLWTGLGAEGTVDAIAPADALNWPSTGRVGELAPLFPRIETEQQ
ncbi:methionine--tRNA ligase [Gulosibacter bifidus]|uniref:Methionine--tRNA ligase n=1 Tax=Gulosibacter bifidus TaxID=272239 RepID=A0ABW5RGX7_9MICO|nr:methionine--tRNA ligase [Gulosibacter bifidus]